MIDGAGTHNYSYDIIDRLTAATHPNQTNESYTYDDVGNRTASHQGSNYSYQAFNRLVAANGTSFGYDPNGNLILKTSTGGSWTYVWDYEGRLKQSALSGGAVVTYSYDALGRRVQRTSSVSGTTKFVYDDFDVIRDLDNTNTTVADYLNSLEIDQKLGETINGTTGYFISDHLDSAQAKTDANGNVTSAVTYDSYGNVTNGSVGSRYAYTGREIDSESSLMFYRARWYDQQQGRFISGDPTGLDGGINPYAYVENDPINFHDPLGLRKLPRSRTQTRPCNPAEMAKCVKTCGSKGVESCRVSQTFRMVRHKGLGLYKWVDGPMSCSCNDDCDDSKVPVPLPVPVRRRLDQPGLDELRMREESARQMEKFWTKVLIGDAIIGVVLLAPQLTPVIMKVAPRAVPNSGPPAVARPLAPNLILVPRP
jgi:RHS repeat-associated protein